MKNYRELMKAAQKSAAMILLVTGGIASAVVYGQDDSDNDDDERRIQPGTAVEPYVEYRKHIESTQNIAPLDTGLFGESVSLYNGSTEFTVVDIDVPGNNDLPVQLSRRLAVDVQPQRNFPYNELLGGIGNWDVDVPYMAATYPQSTGWNTNRCSLGSVPPLTIGPNGSFNRAEVWQGISVHIPGRGDVAALGMQTQTPRPSIGGPYRLTTVERDVFDCIPLQNGVSGEEGFRMTTTSGVRYYFDVKTTRTAATLEETGWSGGFPQAFILHRERYYLLASKIEDRFGNTVQFLYNNNGYPTYIWSNDGREIVLAYTNGRLTSATSYGQTWLYQYQHTGGESRLWKVTRPDNSEWQYDYKGTLLPYMPGSDVLPPLPECQNDQPIIQYDYSLRATHPSGAKGTFNFNNRRHYRSGVHASECELRSVEPNIYKLLVPNYFDVMSLDSKTITGPGLAQTMNWSYNYGVIYQPRWGNYGDPINYPCTTCDPHKTVTVTNPDSSQERYRFGILYQVSDGRQLRVQTLTSGGLVMRTEFYEYLAESDVPQQPFHGEYGSVLGSIADPVTARVRPLVQRTINQQNTDFNYIANNFDGLARPARVTRGNSQNENRVEDTTYHDNLSKWILGQVASLTVGATVPVEVAEQTTYHGTWAVPLVSTRFGKTVQTLGWDTTSSVASGQRGTLSTVTDGNNNTTTLTNWKRGIPRAISYADGTSTSAEVNDDGTIDWVTDENGYRTCYDYDGMGRLTQITYPAEVPGAIGVCDTSSWNPTTQTFVQSTSSIYGIAAGHWRQTVSTGNGHRITYFDALWRPLLVHEYDGTDSTSQIATRRFSRFEYDHEGRTTFASYPSTSSSASTGIRTTYDVLGRVTAVVQDSELGPLTTTTEYLKNSTGYYTQVSDPRNDDTDPNTDDYFTQTWYQAFDEPDYETPLAIGYPEGAATVFARDFLGQVKFIRRQDYTQSSLAELDWNQILNGGPTISATREYVYNSYRELCKIVEPETGATIMTYDDAGNLEWSKSDSTLTGTSTCDTGSIPVNERTRRQYDERNRITELIFPDGRGNTTYNYTPDGLLGSIYVENGDGNVIKNIYGYNRRRLLTSDWLERNYIDRNVYSSYNRNGHLTSELYAQSYLPVYYVPNALGQTTDIRPYAPNYPHPYVTNVTYHPNGALKQFTYGNGIVRTMTQNARGLPERISDSYDNMQFVDDNYDYDASGNVAGISDGATGTNFRGDRDMEYDGLNRLTSVTSPMFGTASYAYDELDNLTRVNLSGGTAARNYHLCYASSTNRLVSVRTGSCSGSTVMSFLYDDQGNVTSKTGTTFDFDYGNRLREVTGAGTTSRYTYDGYGRRVINWVSGTDGGYRYSHYMQDGRLAWAHDARFSAKNHYIYLGNSLVAIDWSAPGSSTVKYQHNDALGSPIAVTDNNRNVLERSEYEPYGAVLNRSLRDDPGYTGHMEDAATGLNYMQQRYYDPAIGRFLSVDPVAADPQTGANFNRYWYVTNNPYRYIDPDGRVEKDFIDDDPPQGTGFFDGAYVSQKQLGEYQVRYSAQFSDPNISQANQQVLKEAALTAIPGGLILKGVRWGSALLRGANVTRGAGGGGQLARRFGTSPERVSLLERVITSEGGINTSRTVARQLARGGARQHIPNQSILDVVGSGTRVADPQGVAGQFLFRAPASFNRSQGSLEVLVHEPTGQIRHVLFRSGVP